MKGKFLSRLDHPLSRFFLWSSVTSLLTLVLARLPGLRPVLPVSAAPLTQESSTFTGRILQAAHKRWVALVKTTGAITLASVAIGGLSPKDLQQNNCH